MKNKLFLLVAIIGASTCSAQTKAITDVGDEVLLYGDGSWKYANEKAHPSYHDSVVKINKTVFTKEAGASFLVKSKVINAGVYIVPGQCEFEKGTSNEATEYRFRFKLKDSWGLAITEKVEVPLTNLPDIVLANAMKKASEVEMVKIEYRTVNGSKILCLQYKGVINGIKFMWLGYYYSSSSGTIQLITGTSENLFRDNHAILEDFLNGFVVL